MEKQKRKSNSINISESDWQESVSFIRHHTENGETKGKIKDADIDGRNATIRIQPTGLDRIISCELDASIHAEEKSEFEEFVHEQGYEPTESDLLTKLEGSTCQLNVYTNNGDNSGNNSGNNNSRNRGSDTGNVIRFKLPQSETEEVKRTDLIKDNIASLGFGYLLGVVPAVNFLILYIIHSEALGYEDEEFNYGRKNFYFVTGMATSILFIYGLIIPGLLLT